MAVPKQAHDDYEAGKKDAAKSAVDADKNDKPKDKKEDDPDSDKDKD
jgi:hypothetical protein